MRQGPSDRWLADPDPDEDNQGGDGTKGGREDEVKPDKKKT